MCVCVRAKKSKTTNETKCQRAEGTDMSRNIPYEAIVARYIP